MNHWQALAARERQEERRRLAQIAATKRWKAKNPDKVAAQKRRWRERKANERG